MILHSCRISVLLIAAFLTISVNGALSADVFDSTEHALILKMHDELKECADSVTDDYEITRIIDHFIESGDIDFALKLAAKIDSAQNKSYILFDFTEAIDQQHDTSLVMPMVLWAMQELPSININLEKMKFLSAISEYSFYLKDTLRIKSISQFLLAEVERMDDEFYKSQILANLADLQIHLGHYQRADSLLWSSLEHFEKNDRRRNPEFDLPQYRLFYCEFSGHYEFGRLIKKIASCADKLPTINDTDSILKALVRAMINTKGNGSEVWDIAQSLNDIFSLALKLNDYPFQDSLVFGIGFDAMKLQPSFQKRDALDALYNALYDRGGLGKLNSFKEYIIRHFDGIDNTRHQAILLGSFTSIATQNFITEQRWKDSLIVKSILMAQTIGSSYHEAVALYAVGQSLVYLKRLDWADSVLELAINPALQIKDANLRAIQLNLIAKESINCINYERADSLSRKAILSAMQIDAKSFYFDGIDVIKKSITILTDSVYKNSYDSIVPLIVSAQEDREQRYYESILRFIIQKILVHVSPENQELLLRAYIPKADSFSNKKDRVFFLIDLAYEFASIHETTKADSLFALAHAKIAGFDNVDSQNESLLQLAELAIRLNNEDECFRILQGTISKLGRIKKVLPDDTLPENARLFYYHDEALSSLVDLVFDLENPAKQDLLLAQLLDRMIHSSLSEFRGDVCRELVDAMEDVEDIRRRDSLIGNIVNTITEIGDPQLRQRLFIDFCGNLVIANGDDSYRDQILLLVEKIADKTDDQYIKATLFLDLFYKYQDLENKDKAESCIEKSFAASVEIKNDERDKLMRYLAYAYSKLGNVTKAWEMIRNCHTTAINYAKALQSALTGLQYYREDVEYESE